MSPKRIDHKNPRPEIDILRGKVSELETKLKDFEDLKYQLGEREKELRSLRQQAHLLSTTGKTFREILQSVVDIMKPAWQYPEITEARLSIHDAIITTPGFKETSWKQSTPVYVHQRQVGELDVVYLKQMPVMDEGPFLKEERALIEAYAKNISRYIELNELFSDLESREQHYRITLNSIGDAVIATDLKGRITEMNPVAEKLTGWSIEEVKLRPLAKIFNIVHAITGQKAESPIKKVLKTGNVVGLANDTKLISRDGKEYQIADSGSPIKDESGTISGVVIVFRDVTQTYQIQQELQESQKQFFQLFENSPIPTSLVGKEDAKYILINSAWCHFLGFSKEEAIGKRAEELKIIDTGTLEKLNIGFIEKGKIEHAEIAVYSKTREKKVILITIKELRVSGKNYVICSMIDITERKQAEEKAREKEYRYRQTLDNMLEGAQIIDFDWRYIYLNDAVVKQSRKRKEELLGRRMMEVFHGIEKTDLFSHLKKCMSERCSLHLENKFEYSNGNFGWFNLSIQPSPEGIFILSIDITEQKRTFNEFLQAKEEAETNEKYLKTLIEKSPLPMVVTDENQDIEFFNEKFTKQFGYTTKDLKTAEEWWQMAYPDPEYREKVQLAWMDAIAFALKNKTDIATQEWELTIKDRSKRLCVFDMVPLGKKNLIVMQDITERRKTLEELRTSELRFRSFVENANDIVYSISEKGLFTYVSPNWLEFMGEPAEDAIGKPFADYVHPDDISKCQEFLDKVLSTGEKQSYVEYRVRHTNGDWRWHVSNGSLIRNNAEEIIGIMGIARDVSDQKQSELALRQSEARYKSLAANFPDGALFLLDKNWRYLAANGQAFKAAGLRSEDVEGKTVQEVFPELWDQLKTYMKQAFEGKEVYYEVTYKGRQYSNQAVILDMSSGMPEQVLVITRDITEQKRVQAEHDKLLQQLAQAQKMESIGRLAGGVAHDYNNMLNVISGYAEMAMDKVEKHSALHEDLTEIRRAADRSSDITRQLLAFARKQTIQPIVVDFNEIIEGLLKMVRRLIGEDIKLIFIPGKEIWHVKVDPAQIDQILVNLCVNARDAISGIGEVRIETTNKTFDESYCAKNPGFIPGDYVVLSVSDDGCGMDKETQKQIFEPFFTTKEVGEGSGLGLSTVYGILKQNEGFINVYSESGKGTTFRLYFPRHFESIHKRDESSAMEIPNGKGETVLVVDDELAIMKMARVMLERLGYNVLGASSPTQALQNAHESGSIIDLLITDVVMPEMNGRDLAEKLRLKFPKLKMVYMSGYTADIITHRGFLEEDVLFIQKPFTKSDLAIKVRQALDEG